MFDKKFGKDFLLVVGTNILKTLSSLVYILAIPILFSIEGYGFYNLFLLYLSYVLLKKGIKEGSDDSKEKKDGVS